METESLRLGIQWKSSDVLNIVLLFSNGDGIIET
jgi:hypothetical protein